MVVAFICICRMLKFSSIRTFIQYRCVFHSVPLMCDHCCFKLQFWRINSKKLAIQISKQTGKFNWFGSHYFKKKKRLETHFQIYLKCFKCVRFLSLNTFVVFFDFKYFRIIFYWNGLSAYIVKCDRMGLPIPGDSKRNLWRLPFQPLMITLWHFFFPELYTY